MSATDVGERLRWEMTGGKAISVVSPTPNTMVVVVDEWMISIENMNFDVGGGVGSRYKSEWSVLRWFVLPGVMAGSPKNCLALIS